MTAEQFLHIESLSCKNLPGKQGKHIDIPVDKVYFPVSQKTQFEEPDTEYVPFGHEIHVEAPNTLLVKLPEGQTLHEVIIP